jgi:hypothetical protein
LSWILDDTDQFPSPGGKEKKEYVEQIFVEKSASNTKSKNLYLRAEVITALWALTEAALGGILHAFRIPFTGLFVNSGAVLFMVLIASATDKKGVILRATFIVMIVKGIVSPHTPITAYIAVGFQGLMGELLLRSKKYLLLSSILLGAITLLQSAMQKIVILTIVYGNSLWESINVLVNFILDQMPFFSILSDPVNFSFWLIITYVGIHLLAGIVVGIVAARIPGWIEQEIENEKTVYHREGRENNFELQSTKKKRSWLKKPSIYAVIIFAGIIVVLSYLFPEISETQGIKALIMIIRSTCILAVWYILIGPYLLKLAQKYLRSKQNKYAEEVQKTINILIPLRYIIYKSWNESQRFAGFERIKNFTMMSLITILSTEFDTNEDD